MNPQTMKARHRVKGRKTTKRLRKNKKQTKAGNPR